MDVDPYDVFQDPDIRHILKPNTVFPATAKYWLSGWIFDLTKHIQHASSRILDIKIEGYPAGYLSSRISGTSLKDTALKK